MKKIFRNPIALIFWIVIVIFIINLVRIQISFKRGAVYSKAIVFDMNLGPKGGCRVYYLYEFNGEIFKGDASAPGKPCKGNFYKGQIFSVKIAKSNPRISRLAGSINDEEVINVDSLYQLYLLHK